MAEGNGWKSASCSPELSGATSKGKGTPRASAGGLLGWLGLGGSEGSASGGSKIG